MMNKAVCRSVVCGSGHHLINHLDEYSKTHDEEDRFDEGGTFSDGYFGSNHGPHQGEDASHKTEAVVDFASQGKDDEGGNVADEIENFSIASGQDKVHPEKFDEDEEQEGSGTGAKESVIKANDKPKEHAHGDLSFGFELERIDQAEIFLKVGIDANDQDHHRNQRVQEILIDQQN